MKGFIIGAIATLTVLAGIAAYYAVQFSNFWISHQ